MEKNNETYLKKAKKIKQYNKNKSKKKVDHCLYFNLMKKYTDEYNDDRTEMLNCNEDTSKLDQNYNCFVQNFLDLYKDDISVTTELYLKLQ